MWSALGLAPKASIDTPGVCCVFLVCIGECCELINEKCEMRMKLGLIAKMKSEDENKSVPFPAIATSVAMYCVLHV